MLCLYLCTFDIFFFFKQKTAYEMRISDWSSDVCSSDLKFAVAADFAGIHLFPTIQVFLGCLPIYAVMTRGHAPLGWLDTVAAIVTFGAITIEMVADFQLHHFIATKKPGSFIKRSEEHTSELQSLMRTSYAVFCLKKKTYKTYNH